MDQCKSCPGTEVDDVDAEINLSSTTSQQSSFPYSGIFSSDGFLSTIPSSINGIGDQLGSDLGNASSSALTATASTLQDTGSLQVQGEGHQGQLFKIDATTVETVLPVYESVPESDLLPSELAFAIDHILEKVLHLLQPPDLLACRLVSHRWLSFATPALQKVTSFYFVNGILRSTKTLYGINYGQKLHKLTPLLQLNEENIPSGFPCNKFIFFSQATAGSLTCNRFKIFLKIGGLHIRKLFLECMIPLSEEKTVKQLQKLITERLLNLNFLSLHLKMKPKKMWQLKLKKSESKSKENDQNSVSSSLKVFQMGSNPSLEILEMVLRTAPSIEELILDKNNCTYFTEPINRIHLLKKLHFDPLNMPIESLEKIAEASSAGNLKLKEISMYHWDWFWREREAHSNFELERRFVAVINRLFECSWDSMETIEWAGVTFLQGMKWPKVMPKVTTLRLDTVRQLCKQSITSDNVFPPKFSLAVTFPKLRNVLFNDEKGGEKFLTFLKQLNPNCEKVFTVKDVSISNSENCESSREVYKLLRSFFPNAGIYDCC